ncbi:uncharacterized protein B0J16DRAFT_404867 [Fusarium flagelliforme]|uniref:Uncharacterized protein n=1 Tax=Fusarium flagelliforme TaxID=2675880 RepID=A0A395MC49_9HYPO|nr:uncharacterized protein B0J16DRAFT_404867 [Fusarium flagelliforme]KAH7174969.1 hypothetical protein B0J16DRAFT_404867 [Fusarium flagelliforme]RFN44873.1 hypothetical protein FIE12Z_10854 [Fusarium flagelliforme]
MSIYTSEALLKPVPLSRDEIAIKVRDQMENGHRRREWSKMIIFDDKICLLQDCPVREPNHACMDHMWQPMSLRQTNKSTSIYIVPNDRGLDCYFRLALHNWLYEKWYRPCRNDIEYHQYIASPLTLPHVSPSESTHGLVHHVQSTHRVLCDAALRHQERRRAGKAGLYPGSVFNDHRFFVLQPMFQALTMVVLANDYTAQGKDIGTVPVILCLTGVQEGLSQPITFDSIPQKEILSDLAIRATFETAIDFILFLEQRETRAFGPRPDPAEYAATFYRSEETYRVCVKVERMYKLGWDKNETIGPSSEWVDVERYHDEMKERKEKDQRRYEDESSLDYRMFQIALKKEQEKLKGAQGE